MINIVICTIKSWNIEKAKQFKKKFKGIYKVTIITNKDEVKIENLHRLKPNYIFFPHWSYIIPKEVFETYPCIVFHMTDLPFGRGGSPLQNLIVRGKKQTKISAIHVEKSIDSGAIYLKEHLDLNGSATEIFKRAAKIIFDKMIPYILENNPIPIKQEESIVEFKRRTPEESELLESFSIETIYNYIRMLDAEGYPPAFLPFGNKKLLFTDATYQKNQLIAKVEFIEVKHE